MERWFSQAQGRGTSSARLYVGRVERLGIQSPSPPTETEKQNSEPQSNPKPGVPQEGVADLAGFNKDPSDSRMSSMQAPALSRRHGC